MACSDLCCGQLAQLHLINIPNLCVCVAAPWPLGQNLSKVNFSKKLFTLLDLCVSSLRRGHANLLCIVPILTDDPRRESKTIWKNYLSVVFRKRRMSTKTSWLAASREVQACIAGAGCETLPPQLLYRQKTPCRPTALH